MAKNKCYLLARMNWDSQERRQFVRTNLPLEIYLAESASNLPAKTENISAGGIRAITNYKLTPGTVVNLDIYGINQKPIICKGKVLWVFTRQRSSSKENYYDTGIEFYQIKKKDLESIKKIIAKTLKK